MMYWWKYYDLNWTRSWMSSMNSYYMAVVLMKMMFALMKWKLNSCNIFLFNMCCIDQNEASWIRSWTGENNALIK